MTANHSLIVNFIWQIADDVLRDHFESTKYRDVILPMTVLARIDAALLDTKSKVLAENNKYKDKVKAIEPILKKASWYDFYNISNFTLRSLLNQPNQIEKNFRNYINWFSENVIDILTRFKFTNLIKDLDDQDILFSVIQDFAIAWDQLKWLSNHDMWYVFEELIRRFNNENNKSAWEHFTPREVIKLMTNIIFTPVKDKIKNTPITIYDPCAGSWGMLSVSKEFLTWSNSPINSVWNIFTYAQELNPETYALCKADMLLKWELNNNIYWWSTLTDDWFKTEKFDFMLTNPPYWKSWKDDYNKIVLWKKKEVKDVRFQHWIPSVDDWQLLFMEHMISKMKKDTPLWTRIASVHNGSALFKWDADSWESNIRKYIIENDLLECIIQLPEWLFYNTWITTYIWILSNKKAKEREWKVQLINASSFFKNLRKNLWDKKVEITDKQIEEITKIYLEFKPSKFSKIYDNDFFWYNKVVVERPLRKRLTVNESTVVNIKWSETWIQLKAYLDSFFKWELKKNEKIEETFPNMNLIMKGILSNKTYKSPDHAKEILIKEEYNKNEKKALEKLIYELFDSNWEKDEKADEYHDKQWRIIPDPDLRDNESIPLKENQDDYMKREVLPYLPDAYIDESKTKIWYEIPFIKYFYKYEEPQPSEEILNEIFELDKNLDGVLYNLKKLNG